MAYVGVEGKVLREMQMLVSYGVEETGATVRESQMNHRLFSVCRVMEGRVALSAKSVLEDEY